MTVSNNIIYIINIIFISKPQGYYRNFSYKYKRNDYIINVYPETLDFTKAEPLNIYLEIKNPKMVNKIRLSDQNTDLECLYKLK